MEREKQQRECSTIAVQDGLKCDYSSPLMRAKLCEIALALDPVVQLLCSRFSFGFMELGQYALRGVRAWG